MNLPPSRVVTNGDSRMENHSLIPGLTAVVHYDPAQYCTVWDGNDLVLLGADACHKQCLFNNLSYVVPNPHKVSGLKSSHVGENGSCHPVRHRGSGTE